MELIVYAVLFVAVVLAVGAAVALKRHPEILARLTAVEQKLAGHQPVVVNNILPAAPSAPAAPTSAAPAPVPAGPPPGTVIYGGFGGGGGGGGGGSVLINNTDPTAPGFVMPAQPAPAAPAPEPVAPAIDTSPAVLDFAVVGGGRSINMNCDKTINGCPTPVRVELSQASGQTGATNTYDATINDVTQHNLAIGSEQMFTVSGPVVTVSVSCPGLQMEIRAV